MIGSFTVLIAAASAFGWLFEPTSVRIDDILAKTFEVVPEITSHEEVVSTYVVISDRTLSIEGRYYSHAAQEAYAAYSTTTITLPDLPAAQASHAFTHQNISIREDIYTKVETKSPVLKQAILHSPQWRHFKRADIPREYADIAISGPILENMRLLSSGGEYLKLRRNDGIEDFQGEKLARYHFSLSGKSASSNLGTVMGRIAEGTVDLWVRPEDSMPHTMVFNGPGYFATTTFHSLNTLAPISAPATAVQ